MKFRGQELADAYQAKRDVEEKEKVMEDVQVAMNSKDVVALGRALKEAERLNIDEVRSGSGSSSGNIGISGLSSPRMMCCSMQQHWQQWIS